MKKIFATLALLLLSGPVSAGTLSGQCSAKFRVHTAQPTGQDNMMALDLSIQFIPGNKMIFFMEGNASLDGNRYTIARYLTFSYDSPEQDYYSLHREAIQRLQSDNYLADDLVARFGLYDISPNLHITELNNNYVFANEFSPLFICTR